MDLDTAESSVSEPIEYENFDFAKTLVETVHKFTWRCNDSQCKEKNNNDFFLNMLENQTCENCGNEKPWRCPRCGQEDIFGRDNLCLKNGCMGTKYNKHLSLDPKKKF